MRPLGRLVRHDPRSRAYPAARAAALRTVMHRRHGLPLDQGELGSCTGNAMAGLLKTEPLWTPAADAYDEAFAVSLYSTATHHDRVRGVYPPTDTGSSGLAAAHAAKRRGLIVEYRHAFGLDHALHALMLAPCMAGIAWCEGFDTPDAAGTVHIGGRVRGGHEILLYGYDAEAHMVLAQNSWGPWGPHGDGTFQIPAADFDTLLHEQGDVTTVSR